MSESLHERCLRLCGKNARNCFMNDPGQLTCLSDMLINKAYGLSSLLEMIKAENNSGTTRELIDESVGITEEIINWVKYLQVTRDLKQTIHCALDSAHSNKRKELRYPFPESLRKQITFRAMCEQKMQEVKLVNFSKSGLQFVCNYPLKEGSEVEAEMTAVTPDKTLRLKAVVKYVMEQEESYVVGTAIDEVSNSSDFDFFRGVMEFITATVTNMEQGGGQNA
jgi:hypothetical protein